MNKEDKKIEGLTETLDRMRREDANDYMEMKLDMEFFEIHVAINNIKEYFNEKFEKLQRESRMEGF